MVRILVSSSLSQNALLSVTFLKKLWPKYSHTSHWSQGLCLIYSVHLTAMQCSSSPLCIQFTCNQPVQKLNYIHINVFAMYNNAVQFVCCKHKHFCKVWYNLTARTLEVFIIKLYPHPIQCNIGDPVCQTELKPFFVIYIKSSCILNNILWNYIIDIFNVEWVRPCQMTLWCF